MFKTLQIRKSLGKVKLPSFKKAVRDDSSGGESIGDDSAKPEVSPTAAVEEVPPEVDDTINSSSSTEVPATIMITGGGIIGLLMALALDKYLNIKAEVYEQAEKFDPDVGAGMGLYANGLRVIRDIDPVLLQEIQDAGHPYVYRRWERHDGMEVAVADEGVLSESHPSGALKTMGIRRWKLQQCLHRAVSKAGIPIHFRKKVLTVTTPPNGATEVVFADGSRRQTQLLIAADGGRSTVRTTLLEKSLQNKLPRKGKQRDTQTPRLNYTGVTCMMGVAHKKEHSCRGISFPVSDTTQCHGAFYPTGSNEQCFQFHFPIAYQKNDVATSDNSSWGNLSQQVSRDQCGKLAEILAADGWDEEKYLRPLRQVTQAVKVGFCELSPALKHWSFPNVHDQPRIILIGDAAHPAVPYIGQGAQQGMEDVGTLSLLLKSFCLDDQGIFDLHNLHYVVKVYEKLRIPRVKSILNNGQMMGTMQQKRAQSPAYNIIKEEKIQRDVFFHETMPIMLPGALYDYQHALEKELEQMAKNHEGPPLRSIAEV